jgi:hypothetical protein
MYTPVIVAVALIMFAIIRNAILRKLPPKSSKPHFLIFIPQRKPFSKGIPLPIVE